MKLVHVNEPRLEFFEGSHVCPRRGISEYVVYDKGSLTHRTRILIGAIGVSKDIEEFSHLIARMKSPISADVDEHKGNLFPDFCGFNEHVGFHAELAFNQDLGRTLRNLDIERVSKIKNRTQRIEAAIDLYYEDIKFLAQNRPVDVIVCVLSKTIYDAVSKDSAVEGDEKLEESI